MVVKITEFGAAETVPGSKLLLETSNKRHLIDIGKNYQDEDGSEGQAQFPFNPRSIDDLFLTHAHADHMGNLLELWTQNPGLPIFSTPETAEISELQMKQDAASAAIYNRMVKGRRFTEGLRRGQFIPFKKAKYSVNDIRLVMEAIRKKPYLERFSIDDNLAATFYDAGHIPGSAQILFDINDDGKQTKLLTTYDLGRTDYQILGREIADTPIVRAPHSDFPAGIDHVVLESTYGNRTHRNLSESLTKLEETIAETSKRGGKLILPAFSIMRTHMLWCFLYKLYQEGKIPENFRIYSSSPMADQVSKIILNHTEDMDESERVNFEGRENPFYFDKLVHHKKFAETQAILDDQNGSPCAIIASSGMCNMGRVVEVLRQTISDPKNIVMLSGYQAPGTRGYLLSQGEKRIPFEAETIERRAEVRTLSGLSGHADAKEQIEHLKHIDPQRRLKRIFLKHGERDACWAFRDTIISSLGYAPERVIVMKKGKSYELS